MLHILCKRCKCWIPRKHGVNAFQYNCFEERVGKDKIKQIKCLCGYWTYDPRGAKFVGTKRQIEKILG